MNHIFLFHDLHPFIDRIKSVSIFNGKEAVRCQLSVSLRGSAKVWYDELDSSGLFNLSWDIWCWIDNLADRFRLSQQEAEDYIRQEAYTIEDIQSRRSVARYISAINRYRTGARLEKSEHVRWAYTRLAFTFRKDIPKPDQQTVLEKLTITSIETAGTNLPGAVFCSVSRWNTRPTGTKGYSIVFGRAEIRATQGRKAKYN